MTLTLRQPNRLFVALDPADDLREALAAAAAAVADRHGGRMVPRENLHLTVAFLGDVDPVRAPGIHEALDASAGPALRVRLGTMVARPSPSRARLVALTLDDAAGDLVPRLAGMARRFRTAAGLEPGERVWPHVTLARFARPPLRDVRGEWYRSSERMFDLRKITVYDSHRPHRGPPRYAALATVCLSDDAAPVAPRPSG